MLATTFLGTNFAALLISILFIQLFLLFKPVMANAFLRLLLGLVGLDTLTIKLACLMLLFIVANAFLRF